MASKFSLNKLPHVIAPNKCIIEDFEILAFEREEELDYYSIWHETLYDKRRESKAENERERQIIVNETIRKTSSFLLGTRESIRNPQCAKKSKTLDNLSPIKQPLLEPETTQQHSSRNLQPKHASPSRSRTSTPAASVGRSVPKTMPTKDLRAENRSMIKALENTRHFPVPLQPASRLPKPGTATLPNGLTILNSSFYKTLPSSKEVMKYKLTKLYNKYRGRQVRRNYVHDKQRLAKIDAEVNKSYLNSWLAYTALQALRLPDNNMNQLSTVTNNAPKFLTTLPPLTQTTETVPAPASIPSSSKKLKTSQKSSSSSSSSSSNQQQIQSPLSTNQTGTQPMHLVYIDPCNLITYSNRINPQQVAEYKRKSQILPSTSMSKKSSAASHDVFEIMQVLANTNKVNVSITRNANRPAAPGCSVYSHSVNANNQGIVSSQLHLQAKYYLDSVKKMYAEEYQRIEEDREALKHEPTPEEMVAKYLKLAPTTQASDNQRPADNLNSSGESLDCYNQEFKGDQDQEDELERLEEDIRSMLRPKETPNNTSHIMTNGVETSGPDGV